MKRSNTYEAAFEAYLREHGLGYVGVDETKRSQVDGRPVKNLDFIVFSPSGARLLVDVKGRKFPAGTPERPRRVWESWATRDDVDGLGRWQELSGPGYGAVFVFAYQLGEGVADLLPAGTEEVWAWREHYYLLRCVSLDEYRRHMRVRSPKWGTVCLPARAFRELVRPFAHFLQLLIPPRRFPTALSVDPVIQVPKI